jgi:uncharacterized protein with FMN-binding domain
MVTTMDSGLRRIALWGLTTVSAVALLFSYRTSTSATLPTATGGTSGTTTTAPSASAATTTTGTPTAAIATTTAGHGSSTYTGTVTGTAADTRWGPVQVRATLTNGRITAVNVVQQPDRNQRDQEINADAVPQLVSETIQTQSIQIDMISGATYTSEGYV